MHLKWCDFDFQEIRRQVGKLSFSYEAEVLTWSSTDFTFSFSVSLWNYSTLTVAVIKVQLYHIHMASFRRCASILNGKYLIFLACTTFSLGPFKPYSWQCAFAISICPWCWPKRDVLLVSISRKSADWEGWCSGYFCFISFLCNN